MSTRQIKALLILNDISSASIARKMHVTPTWVSLVLTGRKKSKRIRKAIADAVGKTVDELWPNGGNQAA